MTVAWPKPFGPRYLATAMLYARLIPVFRPDPESRTMLPETMRACKVFVIGTTEVTTVVTSPERFERRLCVLQRVLKISSSKDSLCKFDAANGAMAVAALVALTSLCATGGAVKASKLIIDVESFRSCTSFLSFRPARLLRTSFGRANAPEVQGHRYFAAGDCDVCGFVRLTPANYAR